MESTERAYQGAREVAGSILDFAAARRYPCLVLEGGQNQALSTIEHHEAAVWLLLHAAGLIDDAPSFALAAHRARLAQSVMGMPKAVEVCFRYAIEPEEQFTMLPGFHSFARVSQGQLLAHGGRSGRQEIRSPIPAVLLLPKYQGQGHDGFFLARASDLTAGSASTA